MRPNQTDPPEGQILFVQLQIAEAIEKIRHGLGALVDLVLQITLLLLKVLRFDEQAITPHHAVMY